MEDVPLLIEFAPHTSLYRERELVSQLPIIRNGPAGTFVAKARREDFTLTLMNYAAERVLYRLSRSKHRGHFALKWPIEGRSVRRL
jgi:hypothetical protein